MQTFFYSNPDESLPEKASLMPQASENTGADSKLDREELVDTSFDRLVEWNCAELYRLLKRVVTRRLVVKPANKDDLLVGCEETESWNVMVYDEVEETLTMPEFDEKIALIDGKNARVNPMVLGQLKDYVKRIAESYNDTPL